MNDTIMDKKISILIADDHDLVRIGLRHMLEVIETFSVIGEAASGEEALDKSAELKPDIVHLGASTDLLAPSAVQHLKKRCGPITVMRSIPVTGDDSIAVAQSYDGVADMLLLDSHRPGDVQIGALGVTHSWEIDRKIVESVRIPVIIAGGLGPDNIADAIRLVRPAGVDSKTKTDKDDGSHMKDLQKVRLFVARAKSLQG